LPRADALVAAVAHREILGMGLDQCLTKLKPGGCFMKARFDRPALEKREMRAWRL
jgi:UDP-N-acetyl-D-galactosamine dehydrogenase